jgi:predicted acylesterase/phospholipase RssA
MNLWKLVAFVGFGLGIAQIQQEEIQRTCNVLAMSGGGAFGAVEVGILSGLLESSQIPAEFDIVTGISAGGLNAGFLSYYETLNSAIPEMAEIYSNVTTPDIYKLDILNIFTEWSIYNTSPLRQTLTTRLQGRSPPANAPLTMIGASNLNTSSLDVFIFGDKSFEDKINVLMATSAIPIAFPPHMINGSLYVDGGVISNELINQVLGEKNCSWYSIWFINAHLKNSKNNQVDGLFSYMSAVVQTIFQTFDSQVAQWTSCPYPRGVINACYPTSPLLNQYSIIDFNNGAELVRLGKEFHECEQHPLC